jgi:transketolase C-terminal domain/subunit
VLSQSGQHIPFKIMGVQDQFGESGTAAELLQKHGLTATAIITQVQAMV